VFEHLSDINKAEEGGGLTRLFQLLGIPCDKYNRLAHIVLCRKSNNRLGGRFTGQMFWSLVHVLVRYPYSNPERKASHGKTLVYLWRSWQGRRPTLGDVTEAKRRSHCQTATVRRLWSEQSLDTAMHMYQRVGARPTHTTALSRASGLPYYLMDVCLSRSIMDAGATEGTRCVFGPPITCILRHPTWFSNSGI
jgi:hypothetical protein